MDTSILASFERCCRLCAQEQEVTVMIFSEEAEAMLLQNKLNQYLLIEVDEGDKLPKNICINCCTKLQTVCDFIDTARSAQVSLLNRSIMIDQITAEKNAFTPQQIIKIEPETVLHDDGKITGMEISVDPMVVLQNSEEPMSPIPEETVVNSAIFEDVTHLHNVDSENVSIKLIRQSEQCVEEDADMKDMSNKPFPCKTCKRSFYTELALKNHHWVHVNEDKPNNMQFRCHTCNEGFNYRSDLIAHLKIHRTTKACQFCGRGFKTERNLAAHMAVHLSSSKSFTCKVCGQSYNTKSNLKTHSITHSNERPYHCNLCKKSFKRKQDLKFHINQHTGAKPYKCPFCDKGFASSGNCYSHRNRMHPGRTNPGRSVDTKLRRIVPRENQPLARIALPKSPLVPLQGIFKYKCNLCDHSFMRRDNYTYHMYQHTGEKPFQCSFCTQKFVTRRGLLIHHDKEHPSKNRPLALLSKNVLLK